MIWIKNAHVIDPATQTEQDMDICIEDGVIVGMGTGLSPQGAAASKEDVVIDASGLIAAPGLVDVHVHFRDPGLTYKEDIQTGARAAAKGGFTTVVCMANTKPPVDNTDTLEYVKKEGEKTGIHVLHAAAVSKGLEGRELTDMKELASHGAAGFTDDGIPLMDSGLVKQAMEQAASLNLPLSFHEEDPALIKNNGINHGKVSERLGIYGSPAEAEDSLVARDCMLALHTRAAVNIQHISSAASVGMVRFAKDSGADVYAEVTPHHFTLTEEAVLIHGSLAKMNPPLRTEADRLAVIEGLKDGSIDIIATDHAPHSAEEKDRPLLEAPSGIIGLETALGLGVTALVRTGHLTMMQLLEKMSINPAKLYRLDCGVLKTGGMADLVIFDPNEEWTAGEYVSKSSNSPFTGKKLFGKVKYTICRGKIVYQDEKD
ncbi:dihydroorotase [Lacrimispora amygdalina]|uniref:dihydroorotase n=1 Tax=Lacrimispora amygdalina TaxID=253257 RepID=UPI000BE3A967|nr:dihydroorotase [Lacrimispora amygdalina]